MAEVGISDGLFWRLTLRELVALRARRRRMESVRDYRCGLLAALINNSFSSGTNMKRPEDFFPGVQELLDEAGVGRRLDSEVGLAAIDADYERVLERLAGGG